jgi:hypothetical protein
LHTVAQTSARYSVRMEGDTGFLGVSAVAINLRFQERSRDEIGFRGLSPASSSSTFHTTYPVEWARIVIEPKNAIPILIETHVAETNTYKIDAAWVFDTDFFVLPGGYAPRVLTWTMPGSSFQEQQTFQVASGEWIFKSGTARRLIAPLFTETVRMIELALACPDPALRRVGLGIELRWPTYGRTGITLEQADSLNGPWVPLMSQGSFDITNVILNLQASRQRQFYRLRK